MLLKLRSKLSVFLKYSFLLQQLVMRDIKLKYRRSFLGYLWSILNPLMIMLVMTAVFSTMFKRTIENFPVYLLTGRLFFDFMTESTKHSMNTVTGNAALIKKAYVPTYIFVVAEVTSSLVNCLFSLGALFIVMVFTQTAFSFCLLLTPLVFLQLYIFCMGLGLFLSQASVFFRDIQYIYGVITTAWLYLTPIFYPVDALGPHLMRFVKWFNPMYAYITQFRNLVMERAIPDIRLVIYGYVVAFLALLLGLYAFYRSKDKFILYI